MLKSLILPLGIAKTRMENDKELGFNAPNGF